MRTEEALALVKNAGEFHQVEYGGKTYWRPYVSFEINGETVPGLRTGRERAELFEKVMGEYGVEFDSYLDVGCNMGFFVAFFADRFRRVDGLDFDKDYLKFARTVYAEKPGAGAYHLNDLNETRLSEWASGRTYEVVTALSMIEYVDDKVQFVRDLHDVAGRLCIVEGHSEDFSRGRDSDYEGLLRTQPWKVIRCPELTDAGLNAPTQEGRPLWACLK